MKRNRKRGFTLIELMIVIAIIAILAAILVPNFLKARAQGQLSACKSNVKNIGTAAEMYATDNNGRYPTTWGELTETASGSPYLKAIPKCPAGTEQSGENAYTQVVQAEPDYFAVFCAKGGVVHKAANVLDGQNYPQFDSVASLMCPLNNSPQEEKDQSIANNKP